MATRNTWIKVSQLAALAVTVSTSSLGTAAEGSFLDDITWFGRQDPDPSIPENYQRSFKASRNDIVMVFEGSRWRSLTTHAVSGSTSNQSAFCQTLTKSDRQLGIIPSGFQYSPGGDGRIYLVKSQATPAVIESTPEPVVEKKPAVEEKKPTVRRAVVSTTTEVKRPAVPVRVRVHTPKPEGSYRTTLGNVLMVPKDGHWEGSAPKEKRGGLPAPEFCGKAAARDRLSGRLPYDHTYVLLADDTLVALPRSSQLARVAQAR